VGYDAGAVDGKPVYPRVGLPLRDGAAVGAEDGRMVVGLYDGAPLLKQCVPDVYVALYSKRQLDPKCKRAAWPLNSVWRLDGTVPVK
jgi:hypothetical protein